MGSPYNYRPDSGFYGSSEHSPRSSQEHVDTQIPSEGLVFSAGVCSGQLADMTLSDNFTDSDIGLRRQLQDDCGHVVGSVTVQGLPRGAGGVRPCGGGSVPTTPPKSRNIEILIQNLAGKQFRPEVSPSLTVEELKNQIDAHWGLNKSQYQLVYAGKPLVDHRTLSQCGITDMEGTPNKIFLTTRLRGG